MDIPNANGRTYPREVVENAFLKYKKDFIAPCSGIGSIKDGVIQDDFELTLN